MLIKDIPFPKVREAALLLDSDPCDQYLISRDWTNSPQGFEFWNWISNGNYTRAREIDKEKGLGLFEEKHQFHPGQKVVAVRDGVCTEDDEDCYCAGDIFTVENILPCSARIGIRSKDKNFLLTKPDDFKPYTPEESFMGIKVVIDESLPEDTAVLKTPHESVVVGNIENEDLHRNDGLIGPTEKAEQEIQEWRENRFQVLGDPLKSDWKGRQE